MVRLLDSTVLLFFYSGPHIEGASLACQGD